MKISNFLYLKQLKCCQTWSIANKEFNVSKITKCETLFHLWGRKLFGRNVKTWKIKPKQMLNKIISIFMKLEFAKYLPYKSQVFYLLGYVEVLQKSCHYWWTWMWYWGAMRLDHSTNNLGIFSFHILVVWYNPLNMQWNSINMHLWIVIHLHASGWVMGKGLTLAIGHYSLEMKGGAWGLRCNTLLLRYYLTQYWSGLVQWDLLLAHWFF